MLGRPYHEIGRDEEIGLGPRPGWQQQLWLHEDVRRRPSRDPVGEDPTRDPQARDPRIVLRSRMVVEKIAESNVIGRDAEHGREGLAQEAAVAGERVLFELGAAALRRLAFTVLAVIARLSRLDHGFGNFAPAGWR